MSGILEVLEGHTFSRMSHRQSHAAEVQTKTPRRTIWIVSHWCHRVNE